MPSNSGLLPQSSHKDISSMHLVSRRVASYNRGSAKHPVVSPRCTVKCERASHPTDQPSNGDSVFDTPPASVTSVYMMAVLCFSQVYLFHAVLPLEGQMCVIFLSQDAAQPYLNINNLGIRGGLLSG